MTYILFITAFSLSSIAAYYAVVGLMAIFSAAPMPIAIMGTALEISKIVTASWLQRNWKKISIMMRGYFLAAIVILMFLTSMGIYGFLSKAHGDQSINMSNNTVLISDIDRKIEVQRKRIQDSEKIISQLDASVQILLDANRIRGRDGAISVRNSQLEERSNLKAVIDESYKVIGQLEAEKLKFLSEKSVLEAEVGPLKYIASLIYGDELTKSLLESTVRIVILMIIFVFDPLAVLLFVALSKSTEKKEVEQKIDKIEPEFGNTLDLSLIHI